VHVWSKLQISPRPHWLSSPQVAGGAPQTPLLQASPNGQSALEEQDMPASFPPSPPVMPPSTVTHSELSSLQTSPVGQSEFLVQLFATQLPARQIDELSLEQSLSCEQGVMPESNFPDPPVLFCPQATSARAAITRLGNVRTVEDI